MATDISANLSESIDAAKTYSSSDNFRCGKNRWMVTAVRGEKISNGQAENEWAFVEMVALTREPLPQSEGDRQGFTYDGVSKVYTPGTGNFIDDGMTPNPIGVPTAIKANFTSNNAVASAKIKKFFLAAFNKREADVQKGEIGASWEDASRQTAGWYVKGPTLGGNPVPPGTPGAVDKYIQLVFANGGFVPVTQATPGAVWKEANPMAGMVIDCVSRNQKKKTPNDKGAYVCVQNWACVSPYNTGENTKEARVKRLAEVATHIAVPDETADDDGSDLLVGSVVTAPAVVAPVVAAVAPSQPVVAAPAPSAPVAPSAPPAAPSGPVWPAPPPWVVGGTSAEHSWLTAGWLWKPGMEKACSEADYRSGKVQ